MYVCMYVYTMETYYVYTFEYVHMHTYVGTAKNVHTHV